MLFQKHKNYALPKCKMCSFFFRFSCFFGEKYKPPQPTLRQGPEKKIMIEINVFRLMPVHVLSLQKINVWSNLCFKILLTIIDI
jgi:hypothetical protein